jgi:hypothetical protein
MKSWKARLLILATMLAMLIALAAPASADHWGDLEDAVEFCAEVSDSWDEFEDCVDWFLAEHDEDDGSGDTGSGASYLWDPLWLGY